MVLPAYRSKTDMWIGIIMNLKIGNWLAREDWLKIEVD
jgi:hypothetical protein